MSTDKDDEFEVQPPQVTDMEAIRRVDETRFTADMEEVVKESEAMRLRYMQLHRSRSLLTMSLGMIVALGGAVAFGWYFFVKFDLLRGALCMIPALVVPLFMHSWSESVLKKYLIDYKRVFMPKMAQALGGFKFNADRGISRDVIGKTGVVPAHDTYKAEDCFLGTYKGVKVMFSEARLHKNGTHEPVFQGLFVLLETPDKIFEGHTIITSDHAMAKRSAPKRWAKLSQVPVKVENPDWDKFVVYSDKPDAALLMVGEKLLKELTEASDIFNKAEITAAMFRGRYIFIMIPSRNDMFEPSSMFVPIATKAQTIKCKKEIERILEIIDIFEIYKAGSMQPKVPPGENKAV
jgi:hypothetical protein